MFTKLLAYEIRSRLVADARSFGAFIVTIALASGIVAVGLPGISGSTAVLAYALCALAPVACAITGLSDYWKTLYGQRGYFTMSLPVSGKVVFWAKNTRIMIECLLALVLAVGGIVAVASAAAWSEGVSLAEYTAGPRSLVAGVPTSTVVIMTVAQVILSVSWIVQGSAVMSIGAQGRFNHLGFGAPIIGFVLVYVLDQMLSMVATFFIPLSVTTNGHFSTEIMWTSYRATMGTEGQPNVIGIGSSIFVPLFALFLAVWASRSIEKRTSLR
ncbi:MAG: hypothetical protein KHX93_08125 [Actinomyces sp. oral taxon 181]|nr:hypothetical protein [Actinomyces sp. oral taxon 181]